MLQIRLNGIKPHIRIDRDGIGFVSIKRFDRILLGRAADIASLGVQDDGQSRMLGMNMRDQLLKLILRSMRREISNLRFERADKRRRSVNNLTAKVEDRISAPV